MKSFLQSAAINKILLSVWVTNQWMEYRIHIQVCSAAKPQLKC